MKKTINFLHIFLNASISLFMALIVSILWSGGFEVQLIGIHISFHSIANPILILFILFLFRFCLAIGGKNSVTFIGALFFATLLAELLLRILNSPMSFPVLKDLTRHSAILGYQLEPLLRDRTIRTNSHGLRDREFSYKKPKGIKRILGVGDSFTFGYRVDLDDTYLKQLEFRLNRNGNGWEVINAGVTGYNMWQYLAYFKHYGYEYEPDLVTIGVFFDDFNGDRPSEDKKPHPQRYRTLNSMRVVNFGRNSFDLLRFRWRYLLDASWLKSIEERRQYIYDSKDYLLLSGKADPALYQKFELRLKEFTAIAKEHGAQVLVLFIPDVVQLNHPELQGINRILKEICWNSGGDYLDITPSFERVRDIKRLYLLPYDAHNSPEGHQIIAEEAGKKIKAMIKKIS